MAAISNSTKVRRERCATATRTKEIHYESSNQTEADKKHEAEPEIQNGLSLVTANTERHVNSLLHFGERFLAPPESPLH
jgi:hypothetical protein